MNMVDLLWFDVKDVAAGKTLAKTSNPIPVTFRHALCRVTFLLSDPEGHYQFKKVKLTGLVNEGTFYSGNTAGWMPQLTEDKLEDYDLMIGAQNDTPNAFRTKDLYIIPQYLDGIFPTMGEIVDYGVDVALKFTVEDGFGSQEIEILLKDYTERWEIGKYYQYTITATANQIDFGAPEINVLPQITAM